MPSAYQISGRIFTRHSLSTHSSMETDWLLCLGRAGFRPPVLKISHECFAVRYQTKIQEFTQLALAAAQLHADMRLRTFARSDVTSNSTQVACTPFRNLADM